MRIVTPIDTVVQAGGTGITLLFWLVSIVGAVVTVYGPLPTSLSLFLTGIPIAVVWLRFRNLTIAGLLVRAGLVEILYGRNGD